jgi:hypothetical protein
MLYTFVILTDTLYDINYLLVTDILFEEIFDIQVEKE